MIGEGDPKLLFLAVIMVVFAGIVVFRVVKSGK